MTVMALATIFLNKGNQDMKTLKTLILTHPLLSSLALIAGSIALTEIPFVKFLPTLVDAQATDYLSGAAVQFTASLLLVLFLKWLGLLPLARFNRPHPLKSLLLVWPILILTLLNGSELLEGALVIDGSKPLNILFFLLVYLSTGFFEEILCRGVVLVLFLQKWGTSLKGIYLSVLVSSSLFGLGHIVNLLQQRHSLLSNLTQITYALFFGVFFAASFLRQASIWPAILTHALFDIAGCLDQIAVGGGQAHPYHDLTPGDALVSLALTLPLLLYGLFILRKVGLSTSGAAPARPDINPTTLILEKTA